MAAYKVIQDVEAEDKIIGPLTLRQFIYAAIAVMCLSLSYFAATHSASVLLAFFMPMALVAAFFAFPWGRDQPTELWALAKLRFLLKPRRRIWNQSGVKELVTITAPKRVEMDYTNGLSQTEVKSRLRALADTIDSRGWAIKNANLNFYSQASAVAGQSDRLVGPTSLPQPVDSTDVKAADDILDEKNNSSAQRLNTMIAQSAQAHRKKIMDNLQNDQPQAAPKAPANYWFLNQPAPATNIPSNQVTFNTQVVTPSTGADQPTDDLPGAQTGDEASLVAELEAHKQQSPTASYYGHLHTIQPLSKQAKPAQLAAPSYDPVMPPVTAASPQDHTAPAAPPPASPPPVTPPSQTAILSLASNNDFNVATIAREAGRANPPQEVVIKLH